MRITVIILINVGSLSHHGCHGNSQSIVRIDIVGVIMVITLFVNIWKLIQYRYMEVSRSGTLWLYVTVYLRGGSRIFEGGGRSHYT